jgi:predicted RNA binding protein YcfA (HicA-like mRNA interferase family)
VAKLPQATGAELVRVLQQKGFRITRQRGSHVQLRRDEPDGIITTFPVPVHAGRTLKKGTLRGILRKAGISSEELAALL